MITKREKQLGEVALIRLKRRKNMNIIRRELKSNLKSLIIWCVCQSLLIAIGMVKYSAFAETGDSINAIFESLPEAMKSIFGVGTIDLMSIGGFYAVFFLYFLLLGSIHAVMLGAVILSKEERDMTADFLLVKPVSRSKVIFSKISAGLINLIIFNIITTISSILFVGIYNKAASINDTILLMMAGLFISQVVFFTIGLGTSVITSNTKKATSLSTAVVLSTFMLSIAIDINHKLENLKYITPFKYFEGKTLLMDGRLDLVYILLSIGIVICITTITFVLYNKRDIV